MSALALACSTAPARSIPSPQLSPGRPGYQEAITVAALTAAGRIDGVSAEVSPVGDGLRIVLRSQAVPLPRRLATLLAQLNRGWIAATRADWAAALSAAVQL